MKKVGEEEKGCGRGERYGKRRNVGKEEKGRGRGER